MKSKLQVMKALHDDWITCTRCPLGERVRNHVWQEKLRYDGDGFEVLDKLYVGNVDVMLIGEAPGLGEDVLGRPFIGDSGQLLRRTLLEALKGRLNAVICLDNRVICRPADGRPYSSLNRAPAHSEAKACEPRLISLLKLLKPKITIALGQVSAEYTHEDIVKADIDTIYHEMKHPAFIIRQRDQELHRSVYISEFKKIFEELD